MKHRFGSSHQQYSPDLRPVVLGLAEYFELHSALISTGKSDLGSTGSQWMLLTPDHNIMDQPEFNPFMISADQLPLKVKLWTDDYSNLIQILR
jgi:hypothetical protein